MKGGPLSTFSLLQELKVEGQLDSSGTFTLDLEQARQKLARFQLADPYCYALKLVQCAVAARAEALEWQSGPRQVVARLWGCSFAQEFLRDLLFSLLNPGGSLPRALHHLAIALNAAVGTRTREIILRNWDGEQGVAVHWTESGPVEKPWRPAAEGAIKRSHFTFEMSRVLSDQVGEVYKTLARRDLFGMLKGSRKEMDREQGLIYDHCSFAPIPVQINGKPAPGYELGAPTPDLGLMGRGRLANFWEVLTGTTPDYDPRYHLFEIYNPASRELGIAPPQVSYSRMQGGFSPEETFDSILALPLGFSQYPLRLVPILDGVLLPVLSFDWGGPGAIFYVNARLLDVDLTGLVPVRNLRTLRVVQALARELLQACEDFLKEKHAPGLSMKVRAELSGAISSGRGRELGFKED